LLEPILFLELKDKRLEALTSNVEPDHVDIPYNLLQPKLELGSSADDEEGMCQKHGISKINFIANTQFLFKLV